MRVPRAEAGAETGWPSGGIMSTLGTHLPQLYISVYVTVVPGHGQLVLGPVWDPGTNQVQDE